MKSNCGHKIIISIPTPYTQVQITIFILCFLVKREHTFLTHLGVIYITIHAL